MQQKTTIRLVNLSGLLLLVFSLSACKCNKNIHKLDNKNRRTAGAASIPKLTFSNIKDNDIFYDKVSFNLLNKASEVNTSLIQIELNSNNGLKFKLVQQTDNKMVVDLHSLIPNHNVLTKGQLSDAIWLETAEANTLGSSKVTLTLRDKQSNNILDTKILIWKAKPKLKLKNLSQILRGNTEASRQISFRLAGNKSATIEEGKLILELTQQTGENAVIKPINNRAVQVKEAAGKKTYEVSLNTHDIGNLVQDLLIDPQGDHEASWLVRLLYDTKPITEKERTVQWKSSELYFELIPAGKTTFNDSITLKLCNDGMEIDTHQLQVELINDNSISIFQLGNGQGANFNKSLKSISNTDKLAPNMHLELGLSLINAFYKTKANITIKIIDQQGHILASQLLTWKVTDDNDDTALHIAIKEGDIGKAKELIKEFKKKGISLAIQNGWGKTPLHTAIENNRSEIAHILIEQDAGLNPLGDVIGYTPLLLAIRKDNTAIARALINKKVNLEIGMLGTPLHESVKKGNKEIVELLIQAGANLNSQDLGGKTALYLAVEQNHVKITSLLIQAGANVNTQVYGASPLYVAVSKNNIEIVGLLVKAGAELDLQEDIYKDTALHMAVLKGHIEIVEELLKTKANPNIRDESGETPLADAKWHHRHAMYNDDKARSQVYEKIIELLEKAGAK
jgi:ankyrin repeat protein